MGAYGVQRRRCKPASDRVPPQISNPVVYSWLSCSSVLLLVNDSERGLQICSYDSQASHGGKTQCYKCWGKRGVGKKSSHLPVY